MKYNNPQLKSAGKASRLIQTKITPGSDSVTNPSKRALAPALES